MGLDPRVEYLHELDHSKMPLVYDLQELYRWIVDLSVIQLLEDKKIKKPTIEDLDSLVQIHHRAPIPF